jgi:hypothetical protein
MKAINISARIFMRSHIVALDLGKGLAFRSVSDFNGIINGNPHPILTACLQQLLRWRVKLTDATQARVARTSFCQALATDGLGSQSASHTL